MIHHGREPLQPGGMDMPDPNAPKILAADTSTASGSIALLEGERIRFERILVSSKTHNRRLLKSIEEALRVVGWELAEVDVFAVTVGPGSFTGLRIGLTTLKTLAWASGKLFVGVPTLDVLAASLCGCPLPVCALIDAHKKEVYSGVYRFDGCGGMRRMGPYRAIPIGRVPEIIQERTLFCGEGWLLYRGVLERLLGPLAVGASAPFHLIRAGILGDLARRRLARGESDDPMTTVPLYIRPSEAELNAPLTQPDVSPV
mgnify:CR=1 FL=1